MKYGCDAIKVEEVASATRSKELEFKDAFSSRSGGEGHFLRDISDTRTVSFGKNKDMSRSKSKNETSVLDLQQRRTFQEIMFQVD